MPIENGIYPQCFLHFFDIHFLEEYQVNRSMEAELNLAAKFAFICANSLIIPIASYFENSLCHDIVDSIIADVPQYDIHLMGNARTVIEFANSKLVQYPESSSQFGIYNAICLKESPHDLPIKRKRMSSTGIIKNIWAKGIESGDLFQPFEGIKKILPEDFKEKCVNIEHLLDGRAYTPEHVNQVLFGLQDSPYKFSSLKPKVSSFINRAYFSSYLTELKNCAVVTDLQFLDSDYVDFEYHMLCIPYKRLRNHFDREGILDVIAKSSFADVLVLRNDPQIMAKISHVISKYYDGIKELKHLDALFSEKQTGTIINIEHPNQVTLTSTNQLEATMGDTFNNYGNTGVMGKNMAIDGNISGNAQTLNSVITNWDIIHKELTLVFDNFDIDSATRFQSNQALETQDNNLLRKCLKSVASALFD